MYLCSMYTLKNESKITLLLNDTLNSNPAMEAKISVSTQSIL